MRGQRMALAGEVLAWAGIALIVFSFAYFSSSPVRLLQLLPPEQIIGLRSLDTQAWLFSGLVLLATFAVVSWCLAELACLFRTIRKGDIFGEGLERSLQRLGIAALISAFGAIVQRLSIAWILQPFLPDGRPRLVITLSSDDVIFSLIAIFLFLFSVIVREARRTDAENRGFV